MGESRVEEERATARQSANTVDGLPSDGPAVDGPAVDGPAVDGSAAPSFARVALFWVLGLGAVFAIFAPSGSDAYSAGTWDRVLLAAFPDLTAAQADALVFAVRKSIHFVAYGVLASVWATALTGTALRRAAAIGPAYPSRRPTEGRRRLPDGRIGRITVTLSAGLIALLVAAADEWNQARLPERSGSAQDVLLDAAGIVTFLAARYAVRVRIRTSRGAPTGVSDEGKGDRAH